MSVSSCCCRSSPAGAAQLCAGSSSWPVQLCHGSCIPAAGAGGQLLPDGEGSCSLGCGGGLEPGLLGSQSPHPAVTAAGVRPPCKGFRRASLSSCITAFWKQLLALYQMPWSLSALTTSFLLNCFLTNYFASFIKVNVTVQG